MMKVTDYPAEYYLDKIKNNEPFSLIRIGDGEGLCCFNSPKIRINCDGSRFLPQIAEPMKQIFRNQYPYYHCLLDCTFGHEYQDQAKLFSAFLEETCPEMPFYNGEIWQHLSFDGRITELIEAINPYSPCFVGGKDLQNIKHMKRLRSMKFIETPSKDSFLQFSRIFADVMIMYGAGCRFFGFATGYTTKVLIDRLWPVIGHDSFLIDFGSVFSPYCGKLIRDGMKHYGYQKFQPYTHLKLG